MKWQTTKQPCNNCGHVQVSVHPEVCEYLECSVCHHMNPSPYLQEDMNKWNSKPPDVGGQWWVKHGHGRPEVVSIGDPSGLCSTDREKMTVKGAFGYELTLELYLGVHESKGIPIWWAKGTPPDGWESLMQDM